MITLHDARSIEQSNRIAWHESGQAIFELGRQLMELRDANEQLLFAAQRASQLLF